MKTTIIIIIITNEKERRRRNKSGQLKYFFIYILNELNSTELN
jgi:hypothetical protein